MSNQRNTSTAEYRQQQAWIRTDFASWYKRWDLDRSHIWGKFVFALSLLRAMEISWANIAMRCGTDRHTLRNQYWNHVYPTRDDIKRYVKVGTIGREATLCEAKDAWRDLAWFDAELVRQVTSIRNLGASWRTIGKVVGLTRQGAQQRFRSAQVTPLRSALRLVVVDSEGRESKMPGSGTSAGSDNSVGSSG